MEKGDFVEVIYTGRVYSGYKDGFKRAGFKNIVENPSTDSKIGRIFDFITHGVFKDRRLACLDMEDGSQLLIQVDGIKKTKQELNRISNVVVKALTTRHGREVVEAFESLGAKNRLGYTGSSVGTYYGVTVDNEIRTFRGELSGRKILTLEELKGLNNKNQKVEIKQEEKMKGLKMFVTKMVKIVVKGIIVEREVTVVSLIDEGRVKTGYSVRMLEDEVTKETKNLSQKIAVGRAMKPKTNLTPDMVMGIGMDKKYILYAIAENAIRDLERGSLVIKGIRVPKVKEEK